MKDSPERNDAEQVSGRRARPGLVRRLYNWTIHWAGTPYAPWALFILAVAEASFFPIPPDVLLIAMALALPKKSLRYAAVCTAGSVIGGCIGYAIGMFLFKAVATPLLNFYGAWDTYNALSETFQRHGFLAIFSAALTPIPYKVFTISAGACRVGFGALLTASLVGRGLRFFLIGAMFAFFGPRIQKFIDRYFNLLTVAFLVLLLLGFLFVRICWSGNDGDKPPDSEGASEQGQREEGNGRQGTFSRGGSAVMLSQQAREELLTIARRTVEAAVRGEGPPRFDVKDPELLVKQGAFVTLKTGGQLRGCIGRFTSDLPLWDTVRGMAISSALEDSRFVGNRLRPGELDGLHVEVSVLSPLERTNDPLGIELGKHGIYIRRGNRSGCFLPQVATETGWSTEEFLSHCCAGKAGLPPNAWKDPKTEVLTFTAEIIE